MTDRIELERNYWNDCALDPEVDSKHISDASAESCLHALEIPDDAQIILDVGCGPGRITSMLSDRREVHGIDISPEMIELARKRDRHTLYHICDGRTIDCEDNKFDFVYSMFVFQHLDYDGVASYLKEMGRVVRPGGRVRFQFIEGTEHEPFSQHYTAQEMLGFVNDAGLQSYTWSHGVIHKQWTWVHADKPKVEKW